MKPIDNSKGFFRRFLALGLVGTIIFYNVASFEKTSYLNDTHKRTVNETIVLSDTLVALNSCFSFSERNCFASLNFYHEDKISIYVQIISIRFIKSEFLSKVTNLLQNKFINIPPPSIS
ncbi:MAG: hypothetical protein IT569_01450 [Leptospiraceae bacterium]|nr:hypothetical protein [Leptospiraceae bacterium]